MATTSRSGRGSSRQSYNPLNASRQFYQQRTLADLTQNENYRALELDAYKKDYLDAIKSGIPQSALHPPQAGMDLKAANDNLSFLRGGRGASAPGAAAFNGGSGPLDRSVSGVANPPPEGNAEDFQPGTKTVVQEPANPTRDVTRGGKASTDEVAAANTALYKPHDQTVATAPARTAPAGGSDVNSPAIQRLLDANVTPGAPLDRAVLTPYSGGANDPTTAGANGANGASGIASVRFAQPGEKQGPLVGDQTNGPQHGAPMSWDQQIAEKYPQLKVPGSPENLAFIAAHKAAMAANPQGAAPTYNPAQHGMALADSVMKNLNDAKYANAALASSFIDPTAPLNPTTGRINLGGASIAKPSVAGDADRINLGGASIAKPSVAGDAGRINLGGASIAKPSVAGDADRINLGGASIAKPSVAGDADRINLGGASIPKPSVAGGTDFGGGITIGQPVAPLRNPPSTLFANGGIIPIGGASIAASDDTGRALAGQSIPAQPARAIASSPQAGPLDKSVQASPEAVPSAQYTAPPPGSGGSMFDAPAPPVAGMTANGSASGTGSTESDSARRKRLSGAGSGAGTFSDLNQ